METITPAKTPWHLWAVGIASLLWNAMGAVDFTLSELRNQAYFRMGGMTPQMIAYIESFPTWAVAGWGIGVWFCVAGSILLLMRSRYAFHAFSVSLLGIAVTSYFSYAFAHPAAFDSRSNHLFSVVLCTVTIFLTLYARWMGRTGVLR